MMEARKPLILAIVAPFALAAMTHTVHAQSAMTPRVYGGVEYLNMWLKDAPLSVPLVSTGPVATTHHGLLGPPAENGADSTVLYGAPHEPAQGGNDKQPFSSTPGVRATIGAFVDDTSRLAVEGSAFWLAPRSAGYSLRGDSSGHPIAGIPVYNSTPYDIGGMVIFPGEDSLPFSLPDDPNRARSNGIITGGITIKNTISLWGAQINAVDVLYRDPRWEVTGIAGSRHLSLQEGFRLQTDINGQTGPFVGESGVAFDSFKTRNRFYGANLGVRGRVNFGLWFAELSSQFAPGLVNQSVNVQGGYTAVNFGPASSGPEGIFAQPANEGKRSATRFAFVTENALKLGYAINDWISLTIGYQHLYYSSVVRPTDQIDRSIPKGQTFLQAAPVISTTSPAKVLRTTDFYTHGITAGITLVF